MSALLPGATLLAKTIRVMESSGTNDMLQEEQLQARARALILAGATAEADAKSAETTTSQESAEASLGGLHNELESTSTKHQTVGAQRARRAIDARRSKQEHVEKF